MMYRVSCIMYMYHDRLIHLILPSGYDTGRDSAECKTRNRITKQSKGSLMPKFWRTSINIQDHLKWTLVHSFFVFKNFIKVHCMFSLICFHVFYLSPRNTVSLHMPYLFYLTRVFCVLFHPIMALLGYSWGIQVVDRCT